jgi:hypothetical protein
MLLLFFLTTLPPVIVQCNGTDINHTSTVVAKIGEESITTEDLDRAIEAIPTPYRYEYTSEQAVHDLLENMIDWKLMAQEAIKMGLDREVEIKAQLETMKGKPASQVDQLLASAYINRKQKELGEIPETDMRNYYDTHQEEYIIPERVKIERVIYKSDKNATAARETMKQAMSFEEFMEHNPTFRRKVTTLWLGKSGKDSVMETVAFNLSEGEVSDVFETKTGYCLLRVVEKAPSTLRSFNEVQAGIKAKLETQKQKELLGRIKQDLRKNVSITINQAVLKAYLLKEQEPEASPH